MTDMEKTAATTSEQRQLLRELDSCPRNQGIVWGHERKVLESMIWSGFVSDVYEMPGGALTARVTPKGREELEKYVTG